MVSTLEVMLQDWLHKLCVCECQTYDGSFLPTDKIWSGALWGIGL